MDERQTELHAVMVSHWLDAVARGQGAAVALAQQMAAAAMAPGVESPEADRWRASWAAWCASLFEVGIAAMREQAALSLYPHAIPNTSPPGGERWQ